MKRNILLWIGVLSSALFLYVALRDIAFGHFAQTLAQVDLVPVAASFAVLLAIYVVRTVRWRIIILAGREVSVWQTFSILMIGFFANNVLPARAGEFVRAFLLRREIQVKKSFALGTILVERTSDLVVLMGLLLLALYRFPEETLPPLVAEVRRVALVLLALIVVGMVVLLQARRWVVRWIERVLGWMMPGRAAAVVASKFDDFARGLEVLRSPYGLTATMVLSVALWGAMTFIFYLIMEAFHFNQPMAVAALTVALVNLGMIVPSSPGYVGTYEFFILKSLGAFGIPGGAALAFVLVTRIQWYVFETIVGFLCLWYSHLNIRQLFRISREDEDASSQVPEEPSVDLPATV